MLLRFAAPALVFLAATILPGCHGPRAVLSPATKEARQIGNVWWLFFGICVAVFAVVLIFLLGAIWRAWRQPHASTAPGAPTGTLSTGVERRLSLIVGTAVATTTVLLFTLLVGDFAMARGDQSPLPTEALTIRITG